MPVTTSTSDPRLQAPTSAQPFSSTAAQERSEFQKPQLKGDVTDQTSYILTLQTDQDHHNSMKTLRSTYFPAKLNKTPAHLTLFHALPGARLEEQVLPAIEKLVVETPPYRIRATKPFRLSHGVGIGVADDIDHPRDGPKSRNLTKQIHERLRREWGEWLSKQDTQPVHLHYTVMNKVDDDKAIERALKELEESWKKGYDVSGGHFDFDGKNNDDSSSSKDKQKGGQIVKEGRVTGFLLWKYQRGGHWTDPKEYKFSGKDEDVDATFVKPELQDRNGGHSSQKSDHGKDHSGDQKQKQSAS